MPVTRRRAPIVRRRRRPRATLKRVLENAFRREFPHDTVDISDGYQDNIHIVVVSRRFDGMEEQHKQDMMWGIVDRTDLTDDEKGLISLMMPVSPAQIK
jgi:stress-induced morphogen